MRTYFGNETVETTKPIDTEIEWREIDGRRVLRAEHLPQGTRLRVLDQVSENGLHVIQEGYGEWVIDLNLVRAV